MFKAKPNRLFLNFAGLHRGERSTNEKINKTVQAIRPMIYNEGAQ